jgi:hypothetical protein
MKRAATWVFYAIGTVAILYLALYLYTALTAPKLTPGEPIRIFRRPDAPDYSAVRDSPLGCSITGRAPCSIHLSQRERSARSAG